jgi:hypothetical protein
MIILIILYTLLIFVYFSIDCTTLDESKVTNIFLYIEISILSIFSIEIILNIIALRSYYMRDPWNIFDIIIIALSIIFVLLDLFINSQALNGILKIRGIFRLLRIFILIRKLNTIRVKRDLRQRKMIS